MSAAAEHLLHIVMRSLAQLCSVATSHHMLQCSSANVTSSTALLHSAGWPDQCCHSRLEVQEEEEEEEEVQEEVQVVQEEGQEVGVQVVEVVWAQVSPLS